MEAANPFLNRYSVDAATAWVDEALHALDKEDAPLRTARGLMLVEDIRATQPIPAEDRAAVDGFAVEASASLGASVYNPIRLPLIARIGRELRRILNAPQGKAQPSQGRILGHS